MATNDRSDYCCCCSAQRTTKKAKCFKTSDGHEETTIIQYQACLGKNCWSSLRGEGSHPKTSLYSLMAWSVGRGRPLEFFDHEISWLKLFPPDLSRWRSSLRKNTQCIISCTFYYKIVADHLEKLTVELLWFFRNIIQKKYLEQKYHTTNTIKAGFSTRMNGNFFVLHSSVPTH